MREHDSFLFWSINLLIMVAILCAVILNPLDKKNSEKLKPVDRTKIISTDVSGNVESIHPWGRTEIVPIKSVELEYFQYCDEWVMNADVVQPDGRKNYFMPILRGHLDLNVKEMTQTWTEYGSYATGPETNEETYEDFRLAHIKVKRGKIINIEYSHYRLLSNKTWNIIASWKGIFNPDTPVPPKFIKDGKEEYPKDANKLMMDVKMALFTNKHLIVDKCEKCVKLKHDNGYVYCEIVDEYYRNLIKEYECMGTFNCQKPNGNNN